MNDRSVFALLAVPAAWVVVGLFNSTTVGVERDGSNGASAEKVEQAPQQKSRRLITACDVLSDYAAQRVQKTESDKPTKVSVSRGGLELKVTSKGEEDKKACNFDEVRKALRNLQIYLHISFVFVPDPTATTLGLETDRAIDAIRLAFSSEGFVPYKSNELPWKGSKSSEKDNRKPDEAEESTIDKDRPGIWLFRRGDGKSNKLSNELRSELRLLFLVGDTPTAGISKTQFHNAVDQFRALNPKDPSGGYPKLEIVGPIFSGSVDSLAYALKTLCLPTENCPIWNVEATTGTAEVKGIADRLRNNSLPEAIVNLVQISKVGAFENFLKLLEGIGSTVVLAESDTVFGSSSVSSVQSQKQEQTEFYNYSRNLLSLRTAYASDKDLMSRIFPKSFKQNQLELKFGFSRDPTDAMPTFAPENFAVSQQITLRHLAGNLRRRHIRNLLIVSSDSLDSVFLARFFQEENPNLRIALLDSDVLLDREAGAVSLRGVLTISQQPTGAVTRNGLGLPDGLADGILRACKLQFFKNPAIQEKPNSVVSVVGFDGEWPIKLIGFDGATPIAPTFTWAKAFVFKWGPPMLAYLILLSWLTLTPYFVHRWFRRSPALLIKLIPFCREISDRPPAKTDSQGKEIPSDPVFKSDQSRIDMIRSCLWTGLMALGIPLIVGLVASFLPTKSEEYPAIVARYFFFSNGVSPLLPLTALCLVFHACAWSRVRSHYLSTYVFRPEPFPLPLADGKDSGMEIKHLLDQVSARAKSFFVDDLHDAPQASYRKRLVNWFLHRRWITAFSIAALVCMSTYDIVIRDVEIELNSNLSQWIWTPLFASSCVLIVNAISRLWLLWISLRGLLRCLEFHPLRLDFTTLPDRISWTSIWSIAGTRPTFISLQMSGDYISAINQLKPDQAAQSVRDKIEQFMAMFHEEKFDKDEKALINLSEIQTEIQILTGRYVKQLQEDGSWISQRVKWQHTGEKESGKAKSSWPFPLNMKLGDGTTGILEQPQESNKEKIEKLKGEFIALQYAAFIRYAFMQLRNLLGFLATASTLVFIALNVYPFQPMGTLTNFATFLFALGAIVVVTVFYQMEKDPLLSRLANTTAGKLESGFALRLLQFGALPTVTFLATHFPPIGQALVRITQIIPGLAKL